MHNGNDDRINYASEIAVDTLYNLVSIRLTGSTIRHNGNDVTSQEVHKMRYSIRFVSVADCDASEAGAKHKTEPTHLCSFSVRTGHRTVSRIGAYFIIIIHSSHSFAPY